MRRRLSLLCCGVLAAAALAAGPAVGSPPPPPATPLAATGIGHVFVIVLENEDFAATYNRPGSYLGDTLQHQGELLTNYYGIAHVSNPNYIALISGQGPNPATQSDCQDYVDFQPVPAVFDPRGNGQAVGAGCVYPANVMTLPDQLTAAGLTWRGYMEDMGNDAAAREPGHCGEPAASAGTGMPDGTQSATATDQYAARHNPFVYFHSLIDSGACHADVLPLPQLATDLGSLKTTPSFSFITPNLCDDGHDSPCTGTDATGSNAGGLTSVDHFLSVWVPRITASDAFQKDGLLVITTDEASTSDSSSCCGEQPGPDTPLPGISGLGGGRIGTLLLSRCVSPGAQVATAYNHYSLLRSLEDIFGITTGGSDGAGHLGYAGASGLAPFGADVFPLCLPHGKQG